MPEVLDFSMNFPTRKLEFAMLATVVDGKHLGPAVNFSFH